MTLAKIIIIVAIIAIGLQGVIFGLAKKYVGDNGVQNVIERIWRGK